MFGSTKCGKCEGASFKIQELTAQGAAYKFYSVQCASCQTPIGITDYYNLGSLLKGQEKQIAELQAKVDAMGHTINQIAHALNHLARK